MAAASCGRGFGWGVIDALEERNVSDGGQDARGDGRYRDGGVGTTRLCYIPWL